MEPNLANYVVKNLITIQLKNSFKNICEKHTFHFMDLLMVCSPRGLIGPDLSKKLNKQQFRSNGAVG